MIDSSVRSRGGAIAAQPPYFTYVKKQETITKRKADTNPLPPSLAKGLNRQWTVLITDKSQATTTFSRHRIAFFFPRGKYNKKI